MSILIKGIEMPNKKNGAVLIIYPDGKCAFEDGKTYQAVPVPEPHGRLIDADELLSQYKGNIWTAQTDYAEGLRDVANDIKQAPTVIEAEEGE